MRRRVILGDCGLVTLSGLSFRENITSFWYYYQSLGGVSLFSVFWLGDESL